MSKEFPECIYIYNISQDMQIAFRYMKMFNLTHNKINANLDYHNFSFFTCQIGKDEKVTYYLLGIWGTEKSTHC